MPISTDLFTLRTLTDTVLIGPRAAFGRGHRYALQSTDAVRTRLARARSDPTAMLRLRRAHERWNGGAGLSYLGDAALIERVVAEARRGRLAAWLVPNGEIAGASIALAAVGSADGRAPHSLPARNLQAGAGGMSDPSRQGSLTASNPMPRPQPVGLAPATLAHATLSERLVILLDKTKGSGRLTAELRRELEFRTSPSQIGWTVGVMAVWFGSSFTPFGAAIDVILLAVGAIFLGRAAIDGARQLAKVIEILRGARNESDLDEAADILAGALVSLGLDVVTALFARRVGRYASTPAARKAQAFDKSGPAPDRPASPRPPPKREPVPVAPKKKRDSPFLRSANERDVVDSLERSGKLPASYMTKDEAAAAGWLSKEGNLHRVAPGKSIGGDIFENRKGELPVVSGRQYFEADVNYAGGRRGNERILYSNDGAIFITRDHYRTIQEIN